MVNDTAEIGIFGGTGIYDSEILQNSKEITIETPYGKTSDAITVGELNGKKVAFMPRHGKKHSIPPHMINYCANIWAFKELGITRIISPSAVGSLKKEIKPGEFVLPTQFIDFTKSRRNSFSEDGRVIHISAGGSFLPRASRNSFNRSQQSGHIFTQGLYLHLHLRVQDFQQRQNLDSTSLRVLILLE